MRLRKVDYASFFKSTTPVLNEAVGIILQISNLENLGLWTEDFYRGVFC